MTIPNTTSLDPGSCEDMAPSGTSNMFSRIAGFFLTCGIENFHLSTVDTPKDKFQSDDFQESFVWLVEFRNTSYQFLYSWFVFGKKIPCTSATSLVLEGTSWFGLAFCGWQSGGDNHHDLVMIP